MSDVKMYTNISAIKEYFKDSTRKLENRELMALTTEDRKELGKLAAKELGGTIEEK